MFTSVLLFLNVIGPKDIAEFVIDETLFVFSAEHSVYSHIVRTYPTRFY
jgi:hypothetical protein